MDENLSPIQDTTPEQESMAAEAAENEQAKTEAAVDTNDGADGKPAEQDEGALLPGLSIKFNKKNIDLSHEEAVSFAQKGMKYDQISGDLQKLKDHAARSGKSLSEFVAGLEEAEINVIRQQCKDTAGGNEEYEQLLFEKALKDRDIKLQEYNEQISAKEKTEKETLEQRIADGVIAISKLNPEIKDISQISESVFRMAEEEGISIREAYLLSEFNNKKAVEEAQRAEAAAKISSSGSLKDDAAAGENSADSAFLKGLWS